MAGTRIDTTALMAALDSQRRSHDMSWRQVANEAGVTPSLLFRIRGGMSPNARNFISLAQWLSLPPERFTVGSDEPMDRQPDLLAQISLLLRADGDLDEADVQFLEGIVATTVTRARQRNSEGDRDEYRGWHGIGPDAAIEDVDLDREDVCLPDGSRLTEEMAARLAEDAIVATGVGNSEGIPYVVVPDGDNPPWGDDRTCPRCGQADLPLLESTSTSTGSGTVLTYIKHCGNSWLRGPIRKRVEQ